MASMQHLSRVYSWSCPTTGGWQKREGETAGFYTRHHAPHATHRSQFFHLLLGQVSPLGVKSGKGSCMWGKAYFH